MSVHDAIRVILSDRAAYPKSLNCAVAYCHAALAMNGHDLKIQTLYILNNITGWRHPQAKEVRKVLKAFKA
jgi:hypothetical protein